MVESVDAGQRSIGGRRRWTCAGCASDSVIARTATQSGPSAEHHKDSHDQNTEDRPPGHYLVRPVRSRPVRFGLILLCVIHEVSPWLSMVWDYCHAVNIAMSSSANGINAIQRMVRSLVMSVLLSVIRR